MSYVIIRIIHKEFEKQTALTLSDRCRNLVDFALLFFKKPFLQINSAITGTCRILRKELKNELTL